ncbi:MAG TPA: alcohol dehydrogenase catalytic domain-containing protein [Gaiellaceae bacterium]|nr:alcohol dehydrogenase catalytic domain-containing protein [Gaiellaceae bacterium]
MDRGIVLSAPGAVALEEIVVDEPEPGEVRVRLEASGVCGTDLHVVEEDGWGHPLPVLLGHEGAGTIDAVGPDVEGLAVGDRVVLGWHTACGECERCARGLPRQCKQPPAARGRLHRAGGAVLSPVLRTGTFATRTVVPAVAAVKVPGELPLEQACLIGCAVATGVMAVLETAQVPEGASVAVIGCGAVGLSVVQGARIAGAARIRAIDLDAAKQQRALEFGATDVGEGPVDFAFDVVGRRSTFELALKLLRGGGTAVLIGLSPAGEKAELELPRFFAKRITIRASHGGDHLPHEDFPRLVQWALDGNLDLAGMVTNRIALEDAPRALDELRSAPDLIRSVIVV